MAEPVTLRAAARELGISAGTLSPLLRQQPSLAACVVGSGPRRSILLDLPKLARAWAALQPSDTAGDEGASDRQRYHHQRRLRLWWQLCAERAVVADEDERLVAAADVAEREEGRKAVMRQAAADWLDQATAAVPGLPQDEARQLLLRITTGALQELAARADAVNITPAAAPDITPPSPLPSIWDLRAGLEEVRGDRERIALQQKRGELLVADQVRNRLAAEALGIRDAWLQLGERLALQARRLATAESFRTAAETELSRLGLT